MILQWYSVISYVFLILVAFIQMVSLAILCRCSRRLFGFRYQQMKIIFVWTLLQYLFRLVFEICYHFPMEDQNVLCWTLRLCIEVTTCLAWIKVAIIAGYYYTVLKTKSDGMGGRCNGCLCLTNWCAPVLPILFYSVSFYSTDFYQTDECWRGGTAHILNIFEFVDHAFLLMGTLFFLGANYFYIWWERPETLLVLSGHVPNIKEKNNLVSVFIIVALLAEIPISVRAFDSQTHDVLVVASWGVIGLAASLCFCFLDSEIQRAFFAKGDGSLASSAGSQGSDINLTQDDVLANTKPSPIEFPGKSRRDPDYSGAGTLSLRSWSSDEESYDKSI
ncbi:uncharacterized protein LOC110459331 [Mizuhopecten yessoensis]|uniref:Transmembrane protein n=1 Tax=Mizuhopecten yessoensis TaxID=6573 RepID=A0A210Q4T3_MIZYE|nr:uncharacterized protein LOC110459331 [Mizuhopecten yessoensis]XP_021367210.1 uncharacterized protein LOC110459331 [Mizuhopecten yessoensis]XP_021367211.1 uncharacterized protein LOC110459331 [Mizuhopecten yessoensis]XP_021367212.1 uncharacterized protein LOC110459331 [Mizuhopecten yessoensis]OWF43721.1 hypothetical protein KP79_PYT01829 [Mizuhopecten yessoensis]